MSVRDRRVGVSVTDRYLCEKCGLWSFAHSLSPGCTGRQMLSVSACVCDLMCAVSVGVCETGVQTSSSSSIEIVALFGVGAKEKCEISGGKFGGWDTGNVPR